MRAEAMLVFACGRYEGIDARVSDDARARMPVDEVSIGDYVLAGGEPAVLVMIEAIGRLLPGRARATPSPRPTTRSVRRASRGRWPACSKDRPTPGRGSGAGREVPPVLLSGDHAAIARWRRDSALRRTAQTVPTWSTTPFPEASEDRSRRRRTMAGWTRAIGRCCLRLAFRLAAKMWHTERHCPAAGLLAAGAAGRPPGAPQTDTAAFAGVR